MAEVTDMADEIIATSMRSSCLRTTTKTPARKNPVMNLKKNPAKNLRRKSDYTEGDG